MDIDFSSHGVVAVIKKDGKFLMIKEARDLLNGHWGPPHGRLNPEDKNEESAVIRETKEEIGVEVVPLKKLVTVAADTKVKTVSFWLVEMKENQKMKFDSGEISEYGWFTVDEALNLPLYPGTKKFFEDIKSGKILVVE